MKKSALLLGPALGAAFLVSACYQVPQSTAASYEKGTIRADDQAAGSSIVVAEIGMPSNGWVVVHAVKDGAPVLTGSIGHAYVSAGPSSGVRISVDPALSAGDQANIMLHLDTGNARVFEFANGSVEKQDGPVLIDGAPVMTTVTLR